MPDTGDARGGDAMPSSVLSRLRSPLASGGGGGGGGSGGGGFGGGGAAMPRSILKSPVAGGSGGGFGVASSFRFGGPPSSQPASAGGGSGFGGSSTAGTVLGALGASAWDGADAAYNPFPMPVAVPLLEPDPSSQQYSRLGNLI